MHELLLDIDIVSHSSKAACIRPDDRIVGADTIPHAWNPAHTTLTPEPDHPGLDDDRYQRCQDTRDVVHALVAA